MIANRVLSLKKKMIQKINDQKSRLAKLIFFQHETNFSFFFTPVTYIMLTRVW